MKVFLFGRDTKDRAFTLLELLIVVMVIAVLSAIAYPLYSKTVAKSRIVEAINLIDMVKTRQGQYYTKYGQYFSTFDPKTRLTNNPKEKIYNDNASKLYSGRGYDVILTGGTGNCVRAKYSKGGVEFEVSSNYETHALGCTSSDKLCETFGDRFGYSGQTSAEVCNCGAMELEDAKGYSLDPETCRYTVCNRECNLGDGCVDEFTNSEACECGYRTRTVASCTGGEESAWTSCPVKPSASSASYTETRDGVEYCGHRDTTYVCVSNAWTTQSSASASNPKPASSTQACQTETTCGTQSITYFCSSDTYNWEQTLGVCSGDSNKPAASRSCGLDNCGTQTRTVSCASSTWTAGTWSACSCTQCAVNQCWNGTECLDKGAATQTCASYNEEDYCSGDVAITYTCVAGTGWSKAYNTTGCTACSGGEENCSCPEGWSGTAWTIESGSCSDTYAAHCTKAVEKACNCADDGKAGEPNAGVTQTCTYNYGSTPCTVTCDYTGCTSCTASQCWNGTICEEKGAATQTCSSYDEIYCGGDVSITYACVAGTGWTKTFNTAGCSEECTCTDTKPAESQSCTSVGTCTSGEQTRDVTCNTTTFEWETGEWSACESAYICTEDSVSANSMICNYHGRYIRECNTTANNGCGDLGDGYCDCYEGYSGTHCESTGTTCNCPEGYDSNSWTITSGTCLATYSTHCHAQKTEDCQCPPGNEAPQPITTSCTYYYPATTCTLPECDLTSCTQSATTCTCPSGWDGASWPITSGSCSDTYAAHCTKACNCSDEGFDAKALGTVTYDNSCNYSSCTKTINKLCYCSDQGMISTPSLGATQSCTYNYGSSPCTVTCNYNGCRCACSPPYNYYEWTPPAGVDSCYATLAIYSNCSGVKNIECDCADDGKSGEPSAGTTQGCIFYYPKTSCDPVCDYTGCTCLWTWKKEGTYDYASCDRLQSSYGVSYCGFGEGDPCDCSVNYGIVSCITESSTNPGNCTLKQYECI